MGHHHDHGGHACSHDHGHDHGAAGRQHAHGAGAHRRAITWAFFITAGFMALEAVGG
ncbi:MAG TPA: cation transporter, partial [Elusimicrobia bacterium]|nr:cation transporter [Elusimicrobiota bacterium]